MGLSLLLAVILMMFFTRDSQCLVTDVNTDTATENDWKTRYSRGEEVFKEGDSMHEQAKAAISKDQEASSGHVTEAQRKALAEGLSFMALAQGRYMAAEAHFKDARSMFNQELKQLKREARKQSLPVPESVEVIGKQLDDMANVAGARAKQLDKALKSVEKKVR